MAQQALDVLEIDAERIQHRGGAVPQIMQATQSQLPDVSLTWKPLFDTGVIGSVFALSCWLIKDLLRRLDAQSAIHQARLDAQTAQHQADLRLHREEYKALSLSLDATMRETLESRGEDRAILTELAKMSIPKRADGEAPGRARPAR